MNTKLWLTQWKNRLKRSGRVNSRRHKLGVQRNQNVEALEVRTLLAAPQNLGQIEGRVFQDSNGNGVQDGLEPALTNATHGVVVHLFRDGGNGTFDSAGLGGIAAGDDVFVSTANPDVNGDYTFSGLTGGHAIPAASETYFVEQPVPVGFMQQAGGGVSSPIVITQADAEGTAGFTIDDFSDPVFPGQAASTGFVPSTAFSAGPTAGLGGERDLYAERTSGAGSIDFFANVIPSVLALGSAPGAVGFGVVTWDGADGVVGVDTSGLSADLTNAGQSTGLMIRRGGDFAGTFDITVHSGANSSTVQRVIPAILPTRELLYVPFTDFTIASGTGADFSSVGALELRIGGGPAGFDAEVDLFQTHGPTVRTANFANFQPMSIGGTIFRDDNNDGILSGEPGIGGVAVTLFRDDGTTPDVLDAGDTQLFTQNTAGGNYSFGNATTEQLFPDDYLVRVDASNFTGVGVLAGLSSSSGAAPADNDTDNDDNGDHIGGTTTAVVVSEAVTLTNLGEPDTPVDGDDTNTNSTIDFGFFGTVDIALTKSDNVDPVTAGSGAGNLVYTVTATNNGPLDATGVEVTDALIAALPAGWSLSSVNASGTTTFASGTGVWTIGNLNNGDSETLTVTLTVGTGAAVGATTNTATVTNVNETDSNAGNDSASETTTVNHIVDIALSKTDNVDPVTAGSGAGNLVYTVTATNIGPSNATGVTVTDALLGSLPTGWSIDSVVGSGTTSFSGTTWTIGQLNAGAAETLTITLTVGSSAASGLTTNTATVATVTQTESSTANNSAAQGTTVDRLVDIALSKSDNNDPVVAGSGAGNLVYTVVASNIGPSDATGVTISDALIASLPTGWSLVSATGTGSTTFSGSTWTIGDLASSASETLTVTLTVGASAAAGATTNTANVASVTEPETNTGNNGANETTTVSREVDIAIAKTDNTDPVSAGSGAGNLVYTVTATNNGPSDASGLQITDALMTSLPTGWTLDSATGTGVTTFSPATGIWTIGNLANGVTETLTLTLTVDATAVAGVTTNSATISALNETDTNATNDTGSEDTTVGRFVDIALTKSDNADPVTAGSGTGNLVYTVTATNNGPSDATGVTVTDALIASLPTGWSFESSSASGTTTFSGTTGLWTIGALANGATETLTITVTVDATAASGTTTNTATVTSVAETDTTAGNDTAMETTTIDQIVDIVVSKSDNNVPIVAGSGVGNLVYTVTASNSGPSNATGVVLQDALLASLPTGWTLDSSSATAGSLGGAGVWTIGSIAAGATETLTLTITVDSSAVATTTTNVVNVTNVNQTESSTGNNTDSEDTPVVREVDIAVTKSDNVDPVTAGSGPDNLVYTITATNNGPSNATSVSVTDAMIASLPVGFTLSSASGTGGSTFNTGNGIWTIGDLNAGASETLTVTLTVDASAVSGTVTNTVVASSAEPDSVPGNDTASQDTTIDRQVDIALTKSDNNDPIVAGSGAGNLVYTLTATNNGPSDASNLEVTDALIAALPTGFAFDLFVATGGTTFDAGTGLWTIGDLASGDTETLTITLTVDVSAVSGAVSNVATISNLSEVDTDNSNDTATEDTTIQRRADIRVTKVDSVDPIVAGSGVGNLVYTLTASNLGPSDATGLEVTDALLTSLPAGFSLETVTGTGGTTFNSLNGVWTIGDLANGANETLTVTLTVDQSVASQTIVNTATVSAMNETDPVPGNDTGTEQTTVTREIDLVISKTDFIDPVRSPGQVEYTIAVNNNGPSAASNVVVTDNLSALVSFAGVTTSQGAASESGGVVTATLGSIAAGGSAVVTVLVDVDLPLGGVINNIATVVASETDTNPTNDFAGESTDIDPAFSSISGVVYEDQNSDGIQDSGEPVIPGTIVTLFGVDLAGNNVVLTTRTNAAGEYNFDQLMPGDYNIIEVQPGIYLDGADTVGTGATAGSTANDAFLNVTLAPGANAAAFNFGEGPESESKLDFLASNQRINEELFRLQPVTGTGSLGGHVAIDTNANGTFDAADQAIGGATVALAGVDNAGNSVLIYRTTDSDGSYLFADLAAGNYSIVESQPPGFLDGNEELGNLMATSVLDDVFASIALPNGGSGNGFNFLELRDPGITPPVLVPVLAAQHVERTSTPVLSWQGIDNAVEYDVWLSQYGSGLVYRNENVSGTSVQIPVDLALEKHRLWVRGIDAEGNAGPWSDGMDFVVKAAPTISSLATSTIDQTPTISWNAVTGATDYDLVVYDSAGNLVDQVESLAGTSHTVSRSLGTDAYTVWVRARNGNVTGEWCDGKTFRVIGAPQTLVPVGGSTLANTLLEWTDTGADSYTVWINEVSGPPTVVSVQDVQGTSLLLDDLTSEGKYRFWVQGKDSEGNKTQWSAPETFFVSSRVENITPSGTISADPTFAWDAVAGATHYDLWVSNSSGLFARETNVVGTTHTFATAFPDGDYRVWVKPHGAQRNGKWSSVVQFTKGGLLTPELTAPITTTSNRTPVFEWTAVAGATHYELWINHEGVTNRIIHETAVTTNSFASTTTLAPGTYRIWVKALNGSGQQSAWSSAVRITIT